MNTNYKVIKTKSEYQKAIKRMMDIFHAEEGTPESDELASLLKLIKDYEDKNVHLPKH